MPHFGALINHDAQNNTPFPSLFLSPLTAQSLTICNKSLSARRKIFLRAFTNHNPSNAHARIRYILFLLCVHTHARARHPPTATYIRPHRQGPPFAPSQALPLHAQPHAATPLHANPRTDPQAPCPVAARQRPAEPVSSARRLCVRSALCKALCGPLASRFDPPTPQGPRDPPKARAPHPRAQKVCKIDLDTQPPRIYIRCIGRRWTPAPTQAPLAHAKRHTPRGRHDPQGRPPP